MPLTLNTTTGEYLNQGEAPAQRVAGVSVTPTVSNAPVISSANLTQTTPVQVTNPAPATSVDNLGGYIGATTQASIDQAKADEAARVESIKIANERAAADTKAQTLKERLFGSSTKTGLTDTAYIDAGVDTAKVELNKINNQILAEQNAARREIESLNQNGAISQNQLASLASEINRKSVSKQADLAILQMAAQNNYTGAKEIADRKVQAQLEKEKNVIDALTFDYQNAKDTYTKDEQRQFESMLDTKKRALDKKEADAKLFETTKIGLLKSANDNNAPISIKQAIAGATDIQSAFNAAGQYGVSSDNQLTQLDNGQTVIVDKNTGKIIANIGGQKTTPTANIAGLTTEQANDPFIKKLIASAGGKPITDTFAQQLNKGLTVLGQIGALQTNVKDMNTGPIVGAFRGANPWDTNAQTIKAQLNAIVPNLARGVYGEVGVLTDNDIKTYSQTLPNLKSTEDIRNAVLGITVDIIGKSIKRNLEINAANGKDVSGFVDIYTEMQNTRDSIFSQIPGYKGATNENVTPEIQSLRTKYNY